MSKSKKKPKGWLIDPDQVETWLQQVVWYMMDKDYESTTRLCTRVLRYLPKRDKVRAETYYYLGTAYAMEKSYEESYQAYEMAVEIDPDNVVYLFNFGQSCTFTSRTGKALRLMERAVTLEDDPQKRSEIIERRDFIRKIVDSEIALRGPEFSLEQLIVQQELFQQGMNLSQDHKWAEAIQAYRAAIALGDCLPQPWSNLGTCLLMQKKFNEAEAAYRRALEIDPDYEFARRNLENLPRQREDPDFEPIYTVRSPYDEIQPGLVFDEED